MCIYPLVSVIIPVFNVKLYLREAIDSVIEQSYNNLDIVIVDDGSTDGSDEVCDSYALNDKRIRVIHQANQGLSSARNTGLDAIMGDYVVFLDSDDAFHKDYVKSMLGVMIRENADIVVCKYSTSETTDKLSQYLKKLTKPLIGEGLIDHDNALRALADESINTSVWNKLYKREIWKEKRFLEGRAYEDLFSAFSIVDSCNRIYIIDKCLYYYRRRPGSITETRSWKNVHDRWLACSRFYSFIEKNIPEVFTLEHLLKWKKRRQECITEMMMVYFRQLRNGDDEGITLQEMKKRIIDTGKEIGLETTSLKTRMGFYLLHLNPKILRFFCKTILPL